MLRVGSWQYELILHELNVILRTEPIDSGMLGSLRNDELGLSHL